MKKRKRIIQIRSILVSIKLALLLMPIFIVSEFVIIKPTLFLGIIYSSLVILIPMLLLIGFYVLIRNDKYYVRPIKKDEIQKVTSKKLITYSNSLHGYNEESGTIKFSSKQSYKANYRIQKKYRNKGYTWFHVESDEYPNEPSIHRFFDTHYCENKRKYKIIINGADVVDLNNTVLYCPVNDYYVISDEFEVKATVIEEFNWYDDKLYLSYLFKKPFASIFYEIPVMISIFYGKQKDKKLKKDKVSNN